jgi:hypothetical protein
MNNFLSEQYADMVKYMNNAFFVDQFNILTFIRSSINQGGKQDDDTRKVLY